MRARQRQVRFYQRASAVLTPSFQSDGLALSLMRDTLFHWMKAIPYVRREMIRTLAALKTGLFSVLPAEIRPPMRFFRVEAGTIGRAARSGTSHCGKRTLGKDAGERH